jgi:hypothetical protein
MKTSRTTTAALFIALGSMAACAADAPGGVDPSNPDNPGGPDDVINLKLAGKFELASKFDIAANMPGAAGDVLRELIAATDGGDDPAHYILDKVLEKLPNGAIKDALQGAVPFTAGYLNDRLISIAPDFIPKVIKIGNTLGDVAKNFGTISELNIAGAAGSLTATHTLKGVNFKIDGTEIPFMFADYGATDVVVNGVGVKLDTNGKVSINEHSVPIKYGTVIRIALDEAVIPLVDSQARNLDELFHNLVNCEQVGIKVSEAIRINAASAIESACNGGLTLAAGAIYTKINSIDASALEFKMAGTAKGFDKNRDASIDELQRGAWSGKVIYSGAEAPMAPASFGGKKM